MNYKFTWEQQKIWNMLFNYGKYIEQMAAEYLRDQAQRRAPIDLGLLQSNIFITIMNDKIAVVAIATKENMPGGDEYAKYVEFGHMTTGVNRSWVGPNPFMRSALSDTIAAFPRIAAKAAIEAPLGTVQNFPAMQITVGQNLGVGLS